MYIYNIILVTHLKPVIDLVEDPYRRRRLSILIIIIDNEDEYEIKKLI